MTKFAILIDNTKDIFSNGIVQQVYFSYLVFKNCGLDVIFIANSGKNTFSFLNIPVRIVSLNKKSFQDISTIVFISSTFSQENVLKFIKSLNITIIEQICGNNYILNQEDFIFNHHKTTFYDHSKYIDEIWVLPMYKHMKSYIETITKKPVFIMPYIWNPDIINRYSKINNKNIKFNPKNNKISILMAEPNISIHKTSLVPLIICEKYFSNNEDIEINKIFNLCFPKNDFAKRFLSNLNINKITETYPRAPLLDILHQLNSKNFKNILLSHQINNELNFLHFEMLYLGYPLVHNCKMIQEVGYYYEDHNIDYGFQKLKESIKFHTVQNIDNFLWKFSPDNLKIIDTYKKRINTFHNFLKPIQNIKLIQKEYDNIHIRDWYKQQAINIQSIEKRKQEIHKKLLIKHGNLSDEDIEQSLCLKYIEGHEKVLEIGGNIGRVSSILATILDDDKNLLVLESNQKYYNQLKENRDNNKFNFNIENAALSKNKLYQFEWNTFNEEYKKTLKKEIQDKLFEINIIDYKTILNKYKINFDTLILDCEGSFYFILKDFPNILDNIKKIIIENDYLRYEHKLFVDDILISKGFSSKEKIPLDKKHWYRWKNQNLRDNFYECWIKQDYQYLFKKNLDIQKNLDLFKLTQKKPLKISIVGTHQTGSTRAYNLFRLLYENLNKSVFSCSEYSHDKDSQYDVIVNKTHYNLDDVTNYDIVILPIRHLFDAALSENKRIKTNYIDSCLDNIKLFNQFKPHSHFIFFYEKYSLNYIKLFVNYLQLDINDNNIIKIMKQLDNMIHSKDIVKIDDFNDETYRKTLLSQHHNTSGGKSFKYISEMNQNEKKELLDNKEIYNFLLEYEYLNYMIL